MADHVLATKSNRMLVEYCPLGQHLRVDWSGSETFGGERASVEKASPAAAGTALPHDARDCRAVPGLPADIAAHRGLPWQQSPPGV
jgi:hypothetical protein